MKTESFYADIRLRHKPIRGVDDDIFYERLVPSTDLVGDLLHAKAKPRQQQAGSRWTSRHHFRDRLPQAGWLVQAEKRHGGDTQTRLLGAIALRYHDAAESEGDAVDVLACRLSRDPCSRLRYFIAYGAGIALDNGAGSVHTPLLFHQQVSPHGLYLSDIGFGSSFTGYTSRYAPMFVATKTSVDARILQHYPETPTAPSWVKATMQSGEIEASIGQSYPYMLSMHQLLYGGAKSIHMGEPPGIDLA